ncbi:hypothetical protein H5410_046192 [Solanum commersonii]|uniref:Ubiquitin-like protease family profile domain-containing protein n=1 Tax=Solanum commersonii TaxID=4109 RepID=A0A9J5XEZ3_SOLCO|nr:hypothetical protein H5410_046192 [Solanum commersonii]
MILESENVKYDMFVVKINGIELRFGIKKFVAITDLKCGLLTDFSSHSYIPNRLILKYFGDMAKVPKLDFFNKFKHANFFETEDHLKIGILYFITLFLTGSEASKTTIPKLYFDLIESGQYVNFPWDNECFRLTLKACSRRLGKNLMSFKFSQFHIALQVWFYECCHPFDNTIAIRVSNVTPRILNWKKSNEITMRHETEDQATSERHNVDFDEKYVELKKENAEVWVEWKELKDNVDKDMTDMKAYVDNSTKLIIKDDARQHVEESEKAPMDQPSVSMREYVHTSITDDEAQKSNDQTVGVVFNADIPGSSNSKPPTLDDYPNFTMTHIVALDPILNANTTPDVQPRNRNPGKYDTSLYIRLSEGESSSRRVPILFRIKYPFESHNRFEVAAELIDEFNKSVFKDVSSRHDSTVDCWFMTWVDNIEKQWRESNCDMRSISPDHNVGQCIRDFKLLANIPWDSVDDVIILVNISEKFHWFLIVFRIKLRCLHVYDSMKGESIHTKKVNEASQSDPLDIKHMMRAPPQEDSSNDCGLYTCLFAEYISNDVFDMRSIDIDAKYHRQRYVTILWHYGKTKNEDGTISEGEVTGTVASKFGGPRIAKEHVSDTTNYPTPRPRTRN